jgi:FkbM family methyltransferase
MSTEYRERWKQRLDEIARLARGPRTRRLLRRPWAYMSATVFVRGVYPRLQREWRRQARTFFDSPMRVYLPAGMDLYLLGAKSHDSELRLARLLLERLPPGAHFLDIGAHFGYFTALAAALSGESGHVLAVEASPSAFRILQFNTRNFPQVNLLQCAAAEREQTVEFLEFSPGYSEYGSLSTRQYAARDWFSRVPSKVIRTCGLPLDEMIARWGRRPHWIKIDVEGAEDQVVLGAKATLAAPEAPVVIMEYLPAATEAPSPHQRAYQQLKRWGYQAFRIDDAGRLHPCSDPDQWLLRTGLDSDNLAFQKFAS